MLQDLGILMMCDMSVYTYQPWLVRMRAATWRFWQNHAVVPNPKDQSRLIKKEEFMVYMGGMQYTYIHTCK